MSEQITNHIMMIRPVAFHKNEETAVNNYYQQSAGELSREEVQQRAQSEFDSFVEKLREAGVEVTVFEDTVEPATPDSIFPNNWISFHSDASIRLYPMYAENRRTERREDILDSLGQMFRVDKIVEYTHWEANEKFLEGTGSLLLDRQNKVAYAALSERTMEEPLKDFCEETGYQLVAFRANQTVDGKRLPIYHTNVMMCLGEKFAVVCMESIDEESERSRLKDSLKQTGKELIEITEDQKEHFAGNMLQVVGEAGKALVVMSSAAFKSLRPDQIEALERNGEIVHSDISTIELLGGGSARCMMAEVFLPKKL